MHDMHDRPTDLLQRALSQTPGCTQVFPCMPRVQRRLLLDAPSPGRSGFRSAGWRPRNSVHSELGPRRNEAEEGRADPRQRRCPEQMHGQMRLSPLEELFVPHQGASTTMFDQPIAEEGKGKNV